jgi:hypothetical protein
MRILVVFEPGRAGKAALVRARSLAEQGHSTVTVVSVVPQAPIATRCGCAPVDYNAAVRDAAADELKRAREQLPTIAERASFKLLIDGTDPALEAWTAAAGFDLVLLPARRRPLRAPGHPAAAALRRAGAEVEVVARRAVQ